MSINTIGYTRKWPAELMSLGRERQDGTVWGEVMEPNTAADCPNCGGLGRMTAFIVADVHPSEGTLVYSWIETLQKLCQGYRVAAPCPVCKGNWKRAWLEQESGLEGLDLLVRLDQFKAFPGKEQARKLAWELLALTPKPTGFATFYGDYGRGKSFLGKGLVNGFRLAGVLAKYVRAADMLASVRETFGDDSKNGGEILVSRYRHIPVLVVDEPDRVNLTPWANETLFRVLDDRYARKDRVLTIILTNSDPRRMPPGLEYLGSRMSEGYLVEVAGDDMRPAAGPA